MQVGFESGLLSLSAQSRLLQKPGGGCQSPEARGVVPVTEKQPGGGRGTRGGRRGLVSILSGEAHHP